MKHVVKIRWEDVWEQTHPCSALIDASWDDDEEYHDWLGNLRSKTSALFRFIGNTEPQIAATAMHSKISTLLNTHCNGEPRDLLNPENNELTLMSTACLQLEGATQPLDNILHGLPSWSIDDGNYDEKRNKIRSIIRPMMSEVAKMIVSWSPDDVCLKFRRTTLLEALKHFWKVEPSTLPAGVDSLLLYLSTTENPPRDRLSEDIHALRKKCGISLVGVSKVVPNLLVPWLSQLSGRAKTLLTSGGLSPINEMHLYEFLSCVATAVENPVDRSNFVADVLANAIRSIECPNVQNSIQSSENLLSFMGINQAGVNPSCVTDREFVQKTSKHFVQLFSSFNQLLSVGKRCHSAAKKRPNGGLPLQYLSPVNDELDTSQHFPDEGSVSIENIAINDPFVPLWPRLWPSLLQVLDSALGVWHPDFQATFLRNNIQRYALAISDDEAFLAMKQEAKVGGVFGKGGTAGSIVSGTDRRDLNLTPKWLVFIFVAFTFLVMLFSCFRISFLFSSPHIRSGWFNELRNNCFQLLGLMCAQRVGIFCCSKYLIERSHV